MNDDVLVTFEHVSKKFCRNLKRSMLYGVQDIAGEMLGYYGRNAKLRKDEFWALNDINFELKKGECLGLIGRNGAGKSTILKLINGLIKPDAGKVTVRGRVGALIELGAGFNPILTGRENIYINGAVLGFSKKEIDKKFDAIVDFAEIDEFIDTPVQNYSSGMKVRLGFAIAAQMEPDVLLIDEVLAVGDDNFKTKCLEKITGFQKNGVAIILVSHNLLQIETVCSRSCLISNGTLEGIGETYEIISQYIDKLNFLKKIKNESIRPLFGTGEIFIKELKLEDKNRKNTNTFYTLDDVHFLITYKATKKIVRPDFFVILKLFNSFRIAVISSGIENRSAEFLNGEGQVGCTIKNIPLLPNTYYVDVCIKNSENGILYDAKINGTTLIIKNPPKDLISYRASGDLGVTFVTGEWEYSPLT